MSGAGFLSSTAILEALEKNGVTDIPYLPDSEHSRTYNLLLEHPSIRLIRVAREAEAVAIAAGLYVGGHKPLVMIQNTGMFESGDSIRGFGLSGDGLPLVMMIGYRGYIGDKTPKDNAALYTEPILNAWGIPFRLIANDDDLGELEWCYEHAEKTGRPTAALVVEDELYAETQRVD